MAARSRAEAQRRADQIRAFEQELQRLEGDGVLALTESQRGSVAGHHRALLAAYAGEFDIDRGLQAQQMSLGMRIASLLGALALAASVFFLFYQFWGLLQTGWQVGILVAAASGSFAGFCWVRARDGSGYFAKLAAMVAFACFVLNVSMLGSIFNITPSDKAFVVWAALAFLLAYTADLRLLLGAGLICVTAFIAARTGTISGMYWLYFGQRPENFFPAALVMFAVPAYIGHVRHPDFPPVYRVFALLALFLPMIVLANWGWASYLPLDRAVVEVIYQVLGFAGTAAVIWLGVRKQWRHVVNTGITLFIILLYTKFYDWWWDSMPKYLFFLLLGLTAVLFLVVLRRLRGALQTGAS
ncbi:MAG TPA: DUF2157 domain-containing protein [Burkholderiales bacterium]|jgi:hypothetical protein